MLDKSDQQAFIAELKMEQYPSGKGAVLKTVRRESVRGFESLLLRQPERVKEYGGGERLIDIRAEVIALIALFFILIGYAGTEAKKCKKTLLRSSITNGEYGYTTGFL